MSSPRSGFLTAQVPPVLRVLLLAQIFTVFLTGTKLIPGIRNNFGPFELIGVLLIAFFLASRGGSMFRLAGHRIVSIQALITTAAAVSLAWFQGPVLQLGIVQTMILLFQLLFTLVLYNLMLRYQISPHQLLRLVAYAALIIGPWVLLAGLASQGNLQEAGPFRNRAHMANYMLTAFWLVLIYNFWPGISRRERLISYVALASTLYPIAAAGRRSVYFSLIFGLAGVALSFLPAYRGRRRSAFVAAAVVLGIVGLLYAVGPRWLPQLEFFHSRVAGIGDRLELAVGSSDELDTDRNFFELQRRGVAQAFRDYPILGIGWGAFHRSRYSLTGAEVHSTPLRFLAELGLVGLVLYAALMWVLLIGSLRIIALLRNSVYRTPAVVLAIALWSLSLSYLYNRHVTERTFWLLLVFFMTFETFARSLERRSGRATARARAAARRPPPRRLAAALAPPRRSWSQTGTPAE